jgi:Fe2+ or Zn2+ uptake regulation protein
MRPQSIHPQLDVLELLVLHRLTQEENDSVEEHLLICDSCRAITAGMETEIKRIQKILAAELVS